MSTTTEDLQRSAWRELYEMLSAEIEPERETQNLDLSAPAAESHDYAC